MERLGAVQTAGRKVKGHGHSGKQLGSSFKTKNRLPVQPSTVLLGTHDNGNRLLCRNVHVGAHGSFIPETRELETTKRPPADKQLKGGDTQHGILLSS